MHPHKNEIPRKTIRYGAGDTRVGPVLVGFTAKGLCALRLLEGTTMAAELADLRRKFAGAEFVEDQSAAKAVVRQVDAVLQGEEEAGSVPLDLQGTPFQKRVWQTVLKVPRGTTWSYSQLARRAGSSRAVRAAASACARNPIALIVPCHRIVRRDGTPAGCYGGLERRRALLRLEEANV